MSLYPDVPGSQGYGYKSDATNGSVSVVPSNTGPMVIIDGDDDHPNGQANPRQKKKFKCTSCLKSNLFLILLMIGIAIGIALGISIRVYHPWFAEDKRRIMYLGFLGTLFLNMLKMIIIPLVVTSLIAGMASIPSKAAGRLGGYTILYYMITTFMAVLLGILLVATIKPGVRTNEDKLSGSKDKAIYPADSGLDLIRNLFPPNLFAATMEKTVTTYAKIDGNITNGTHTYSGMVYDYDNPKVVQQNGSNILGLVVFSCVFGIIVGAMGKPGLPVYHFCVSLQDAIIKLVQLIIWLAPIGICFLLASKIVAMEDPLETFTLLAYYAMTVIVGLAIHAFVVLPTIYVIFTRKNPFKLLLNVGFALLTAFGTASSSATMPVTMNDLQYRALIDPRVVKFVVPIGATINMDGTALYEAVASIFIAQTEGIEMDAAKYVIVSITATLAAIGAAGVPEAGLVTMMIVLTAIGLPTDLVGIILTIDWFLDRCRTSINVWGDSVGSGIVDHLAKPYLAKLDANEELGNSEKKGEENLAYDPYTNYSNDAIATRL